MAPYAFVPYPSWRVHATLPAIIVNSPEEDAEKASQGYGHPGQQALAPPSEPPPSHVEPSLADLLYRTPAKDIVDFIDGFIKEGGSEHLDTLRQLEMANPLYEGGRKSVLKAIEARGVIAPVTN